MFSQLMDISERLWQVYSRLDPLSLDTLLAEVLVLPLHLHLHARINMRMMMMKMMLLLLLMLCFEGAGEL